MSLKLPWNVLLIGGGAAVGKTTVARVVADRRRALVVPVDAIWLALKAVTSPNTHPELHYFDPPEGELALGPEVLSDRHVKSARAISTALAPVIEHYLWERQPVVFEGAWVTPAAAAQWVRRGVGVRAVFIHEPDLGEVLAAMQSRARVEEPTPRQKVLAEVCWRFGNWVRDQAASEGLPVIEARPKATLPDRVHAFSDVAQR